jgi:hypothetical protein
MKLLLGKIEAWSCYAIGRNLVDSKRDSECFRVQVDFKIYVARCSSDYVVNK